MTNTQENKSAKKTKQSFGSVDIGTPKVPVRKSKAKKQERELLSDWEDAS
ncbi:MULTISPECIES: hypothetical protein [Anabaena]|uniref:Anacyclamide n=2 Tax=Anabaena TaxID=1163 RepID=A0ABR8JBJ2_9NOST|nr:MULTISPECIES: hypothetical protein [Anabaena]MBD2569504.1 hypothetical protein [Anabaena lutea FACHB-196]MBD2694875.1 hypothetical protein [Anabaena catenula FACHB-362]